MRAILSSIVRAHPLGLAGVAALGAALVVLLAANRSAPASSVAEDVSDQQILDEWDRVIPSPPPSAIRACKPIRRARELAARLAENEYYLALARRLVLHESWSNSVRRRIAQLEKRLRRDRASLSRLRKPCRRQIEAWVASRHKSGIPQCDPYIDPLCCP